MATINLYLEKPDANNTYGIYLVYQYYGKKCKVFTKERIPKKAWDSEKQLVKTQYAGALEINRNTSSLVDQFKKIVRDLVFLEQDPTPDLVKAKYIETNNVPKNRNKFYETYERFQLNSKGTKSPRTIKEYKTSLNKLKEFETYIKKPIRFDTINQEFYDKYCSFLIDEHKMLNNTVGGYIKVLKTFLNYATEIGVNKNLGFKKFKVISEQVDIIYLTEDELFKIYYHDFKTSRHRNVRDVFCFACFTGLRFSDMSKVNNESIDGEFIIIKTEKTKDILKVPLNKYAKEIIDKHTTESGIEFPRVISNQKMNKYLKEIGEEVGINKSIRIVRYNGSTKNVLNTEKYNLITTHTARRTFVTLSLEKGFRPELVMEMTGHKDYKTFKKYIKITDSVKKNEMNRLWK